MNEKQREYNKLYYKKNREKLLERCKEYQKQNPDRIAKHHRTYYEKKRNDEDWKAKRRKYQNEHYLQNKVRLLQYGKDYYYKNRDKILEYQHKWRKSRGQEYREMRRAEGRVVREEVQKREALGRAETFKARWAALWDKDPQFAIARLADLLGKRKGAT